MRAGIAAMALLDEPAFARLDAMGEKIRAGVNAIFAELAVPGGAVGLGSLVKVHFSGRPARDYRSAHMNEAETRRVAAFSRALLNEGIIISGDGLMALSTPMMDDDLDQILSGIASALQASAVA